MSQFFASGGQSSEVSASASVLPMNTQDWSPLGWTGWISLQSKGFSRVFSNTTVQKHQFFSPQLSLWSKSHIHNWVLFLLWLHPFILSGVISPLISSSILGKSPLDSKEIQPVHLKGNWSWIFIRKTDAEAETPILWPPDAKNWLFWKDPNAGKDWRWEEKGMTEDEMAGWHHWLNGHEIE